MRSAPNLSATKFEILANRLQLERRCYMRRIADHRRSQTTATASDKKLSAFGITDRPYTIVPLKLDFEAQKKGEWPSRPCGEWSTFRTLASRTKGADRSTQARRAVPLSKNPKASGFWPYSIIIRHSLISSSVNFSKSLPLIFSQYLMILSAYDSLSG